MISNCNSYSEWLTAKQAADYLQVKVRTLLLWTRQGRVIGHQLSGTKRHVWRYLRHELDAALLVTAPTASGVLGLQASSGALR